MQSKKETPIITEENKPTRARGKGGVFLNGSQVWWIRFCHNGIPRRESSHSTDYAVAEDLLEQRLAELRTNTYVVRKNIRIDELVEDVFSEYLEKDRKSLDHIRAYWRLHLGPFFSRRKATEIDTDMVRRYTNARRLQGASHATLNREISLLRHAFNLGKKGGKVQTVPYIPALVENNTRKGFVRDEDYARLALECGRVGLWLRALLAVGYSYGWRKSELLALKVRQVDLAEREIVLDPGTTKNLEGRHAPMTDEVFTLLKACVVGKEESDFVFTRSSGKPVKHFRAIWNTCCKRAGVQIAGKHLLFHDLRRSGVRNLRRLDVPDSVGKKISGHKTDSVYRRYDIIDNDDVKAAVAKLNQKQNSQAGDFSGFVSSFGRDAKKQADSQPGIPLTILPN